MDDATPGGLLSVLSVNVGQPRVIGQEHGEDVLSAIAKKPLSGAGVALSATGIAGDAQADLEVHGGIDKAVYAYPSDHWLWWEREKGLACEPGTFGENLTLKGADESMVAIGDRFRWGEAVLEISQPRAPCFKLALHTARPDAPQLMTLSGYCGWYLRVVAPGTAPRRESALERIAASGGPSVREAFVAAFSRRIDRDTLRRIHEAPALAEAWRHAIAKKIAALPG